MVLWCGYSVIKVLIMCYVPQAASEHPVVLDQNQNQ